MFGKISIDADNAESESGGRSRQKSLICPTQTSQFVAAIADVGGGLETAAEAAEEGETKEMHYAGDDGEVHQVDITTGAPCLLSRLKATVTSLSGHVTTQQLPSLGWFSPPTRIIALTTSPHEPGNDLTHQTPENQA